MVGEENVSNRTYMAIGRFIFEFSQLEYELRHRVADETRVSDEYFTAIMVHDFSTLCTAADHVFAIAYKNDLDRLKEIKALIKKARALADTRNAVAHGLWVPFLSGGKVIHVPRSLKTNILVEQTAALEKSAEEARDLRFQIEAITTNMPVNPSGPWV